MPRLFPRILFSILIVVLGLGLWIAAPASGVAYAQQPTVAVATVTGTAEGEFVIVDTSQDQINVRSGPGTDYPAVGVLVGGEKAGALGRSAAGLWIEVVYPSVEGGVGWVYAPLVNLFPSGASLPIKEPPPTPTPRVTPTIDPTLAAQFVLEIPATRLPTFTAPPPLEVPTFEPVSAPSAAGIPMGLIITGIGLVGLLGAAASYLRER